MSIKDFKTNPTAAVEGIWVEYSANADGSIPGFKIARMSRTNKNYLKALETITKPHRRAIELDTIGTAKAEEISLSVFVKSILLDWRNIQPEDDGKNVDFNETNAKKLLGSAEYEDLLTDLTTRARSASDFRDEALGTETKN